MSGSSGVQQLLDDIAIRLGLVPGFTIINKSGHNDAVTSGSLPVDLVYGGTTYTGFPVGAPGIVQVLSSNAGDTGTLTIKGLKTDTSTDYEGEDIVLNGVTPVSSVNSWWRICGGTYDSGSDTTFNLGTLTCRLVSAPTTVFFVMEIGTSEAQVCGITIPFGKVGLIRRAGGQLGNASGLNRHADVAAWVRLPGKSPVLRRPSTVSPESPLYLEILGGSTLPAGTDVMFRVTDADGTNMDVRGWFDIMISPTPTDGIPTPQI